MNRTLVKGTVALVLLVSWFAIPVAVQEKVAGDAGAYDLVPNWSFPYPKAGYVWGSVTGVFAESANRVFVVMRGEIKVPTPQPPTFGGFYGSFARNAIGAPGNEMKNCIFVLGADGRPLETWTQWDDLCPGVHKVRISPYDPERRVWVVNERRNQVLVFSNDGKQLLMTIGEANVAGSDQTHLSRPQDLGFLPDGSVLVADGNSRVVKFDKAGKFIMQWGAPGNQPGQFSSVHAIAVDKNRRVYIGDRGNDRLQVFDEQGKFLAAWPNLNFLMDILISDATQDIWVDDNQTTKLIKFDASGTRHLEWDLHKGTPALPGLFYELHQISVDPDGTLYGIDNVYGRIQKFRPKPGADKSKLILPPTPLMAKAAR